MNFSTPKKTADALVKPDMIAVLSRTHIGNDLHSFLLPILEAVSNSMHGIEARFPEHPAQEGKIEIVITNPNKPATILVTVTDNGIGLTEENYQSFRTPFSGYKLKMKGRGFGRFIAFKVFSRILYSSRWEFLTLQATRAFRFDINEEDELVFFDADPDFDHVGTKVEYPEVMTLAEAGLAVDDFVTFLGFLAPKGTPASIIQKFSDSVRAALEDKELRDAFEARCFGAAFMGSEEFRSLVLDESKAMKKVIADNNIRLDQ